MWFSCGVGCGCWLIGCLFRFFGVGFGVDLVVWGFCALRVLVFKMIFRFSDLVVGMV